ncbi:glycosyltransferase family 4 protein [Pirellulales bacterium]|nr:glycosyltransferase family 4 protein [Pirellulales bacterium]
MRRAAVRLCFSIVLERPEWLDGMPGCRILHVIDRLDSYGAGRTLRTLASESNGSCRMHIATFSASPAFRPSDSTNTTYDVLDGRWSWDFVALGRLAHLLNRKRFDVVHAWDPPSLQRVQTLLRRRVPTAASFDRLPGGKVRRLNRVARVFVGSQQLRDALTDGGVAADRLCDALPGVPIPRPTSVSRDDAFRQAKLPLDGKLITVAGPLVRSSRFDEAIWRYELVRVLYPTTRLVVVGSGPEQPRLERFARLVGDPERICILPAGKLADALLTHADVYWQTSNEATPRHELIEAMHRGRPIVAADTAVHRDLIDHEQTGLLADADDRADFARMTARILSRTEVAAELGKAAAVKAGECYAAGEAIARYCRGYEALAGLMQKSPPTPNRPATGTARR